MVSVVNSQSNQGIFYPKAVEVRGVFTAINTPQMYKLNRAYNWPKMPPNSPDRDIESGHLFTFDSVDEMLASLRPNQ
jgi:hypothetical protein